MGDFIEPIRGDSADRAVAPRAMAEEVLMFVGLRAPGGGGREAVVAIASETRASRLAETVVEGGCRSSVATVGRHVNRDRDQKWVHYG